MPMLHIVYSKTWTKIVSFGIGEVTPWLRVIVALSEDLGIIAKHGGTRL